MEVARLRAKQGGGRLGSLEMGPLSLPNPGGGQVSGGGRRGRRVAGLPGDVLCKAVRMHASNAIVSFGDRNAC